MRLLFLTTALSVDLGLVRFTLADCALLVIIRQLDMSPQSDKLATHFLGSIRLKIHAHLQFRSEFRVKSDSPNLLLSPSFSRPNHRSPRLNFC